jgi:hypothetical protein
MAFKSAILKSVSFVSGFIQGDQRLRRLFLLLITLVVCGQPSIAQNTQARQGEPPIAALISVSPADAKGNVTVSGAAGAVFPNAQVAVRNLFTGQTEYVNAGITGSFSATLFATGSTPFWVSAATNIPPELRNLPGSLPGGPGTIIYSTAVEAQTAPVTQIIADAELTDWERYPQGELVDSTVYGVRNRSSAYVAVSSRLFRDEYAQVVFTFIIDDATYTVTLNPQQLRSASVRQLAPIPRNVGEVAVNATFSSDLVEFRFPLNIAQLPIAVMRLTSMTFLDAAGGEIGAEAFDAGLPSVEEVDGVVYPFERLPEASTRFYTAGTFGEAYWYAYGRIDTLTAQPGDTVIVELDVTALTPTLPLTTTDLVFTGRMGLQPLSVSALHTNNGWSSLMTHSGLAIDNVRGDVMAGETSADWMNVTRLADRLMFGLRFEITLPGDLPDDIYVPIFRGSLQASDGGVMNWSEDFTRLPLTINVGGNDDYRMAWALFYDHPSDGSRGILAQEDMERLTLSNRVKFNSPTYILPPGSYPVEPYVPNMLPNAYDFSAPPLVPLLFPGGRLTGEITRPGGGIEALGSAPILQNRLSTDALDERSRFGAQSPVDMYRLTTLNPLLTAYNFNEYGEYTINLTGEIEDRSGNRYVGGGSYKLLIAESFDLIPGVLPGTPFEVGDVFYPGLHLVPQLPAEVTVTVRVYPLDGSDVIEQIFTGSANAYGHYNPSAEEVFRFEVPGEYVIDYEVRDTAPDARLWAASLRSAGVIASTETTLVARGRRGLDSYQPQEEARPAWFNQQEYPTAVRPDEFRPYYPYHPGDVAVYADSSASGIHPLIDVQDLNGVYAGWLQSTVPTFVSSAGEILPALLRRDALPLVLVLGGPESSLRPALLPDLIVNQAYSYISAVRPGVTVRQFVMGDDSEALPLYWDANDPLNGQMGAGLNGDAPTDYVFLFGGAVVHNAEADIHETSIYAALGVTGFTPGDPLGVRVYPPFRGADGGTILRLRGEDYPAFFYPTGAQPGQVMLVGETLSIVGQAAPTLGGRVQVRITAPSGRVRQFEGFSNRIGYFYQPENNFKVDEVGVWTVEILVSPAEPTSAGEQPSVSGGVPGAVQRRYNVYVTSPGTPSLTWNRGDNIEADTPAGAFFNFTINIPPGLTEVKAYRTVVMPGFVLDEGELETTPNTTGYQYSPRELALDFPALEAEGRGTGASASDLVNVIFVVTGVDSAGEQQLYTRTFTFMHNRIISFEGE